MGRASRAMGLDHLPLECLAEVLYHLDGRDVAVTMATSRTLRDVGGAESLWRRLLHRDFGFTGGGEDERARFSISSASPEDVVSEEYRLGAPWRRLYHHLFLRLDARSGPSTALRAEGLYCDGGVDESNVLDAGPHHLWNPSAHDLFYCSAASTNINAVACFVEGSAAEAHERETRARERVAYMRRRCALVAHLNERIVEQQNQPEEDREPLERIVQRLARENAPYDFSRWGEDDLTQFFIHNFVMAMQGDALASFLFHDMADRSAEELDEEIRLARRTAQAAQNARVLVPEDPEPAPLFEDWLSSELPDHPDRRGPEGDRLDVFSERLALREFTDGCSRMPPREDGAVFAYRHEHDMPMETADVKGAMRAARKQYMDDFDELEKLEPWKRRTAVVDGVEVSREGQFTCPVGCGAIFFAPAPRVQPPAEQPWDDHRDAEDDRDRDRDRDVNPDPKLNPDATGAAASRDDDDVVLSLHPEAQAVGSALVRGVRDASCASLDGVDSLEALRRAVDAGTVPPIVATHECVGGVMVELEPPALDSPESRGFAPAIWFRFTPRSELAADARGDPEIDVLRATLRRRRHGRLVLAKFIACEDLMEEWEDDHPAPNVDARRVVTTGTALALEDFFPDARRRERARGETDASR